jgi:biopolymer transport protein ExbD
MGMVGGSNKGGINDINITPLVDVVLVLLIIFIVVAPQLQKGVEVQLPLVAKHIKKKDENAKKEEKKEILVTLQLAPKAGEEAPVFIGKEPVGKRSDFVERLRAERQKPENLNLPVVIKGDARLPYGEVRKLMKDCQSLGLGGVSLAVKEDAQEKGEHKSKE